MLCEECKVNEASFSISVVVGDEVKTRHLCGECMSRMNMDLQSGNIKGLLSSILSAITGKDTPAEKTPDIVCPRCRTTLGQFTKSGRLGCPACYEAFREQLQPMLLQIHGRVQHAGREPLNTSEAQIQRSRQEELTRRMEEAVAKEDFETAAMLRDQLRAMAAGEEDA
ncbi:MAG: UvrB/UvrC motif-containing protein [Clostridia bacterium]|nr:UvrB/UvrC motif-containing protein [Clostridia bacterium]